MKNFYHSSPILKILIYLFILLASFIVAAVLLGITGILQISSIELIRITAIIQNIVIFILPVLFASAMFSPTPFSFLHINSVPALSSVIMTTLIMVVATPFMNMVIEWNQSVTFPESIQNIETWMRNSENAATAITDQILDVHSLGALLLTICLVGILTGIGEEFVFRGMLQQLIGESLNSKHLAIWITAFIFSAIHFQFFGFIPRFILGLFLGYLLIWTGNLWVPVFAHALNNSIAVIVSYLNDGKAGESYWDQLGTQAGNSIWAGWTSVTVTIVLIVIFHKLLKRNSQLH